MTIKEAFMGLLVCSAIGLLIGHIWNKHSESKLPRMATVTVGPIEEIVIVKDK